MVQACHTPRQPLKKKQLSFRTPWRLGDAVVGRGNAGWTTSKSGHICQCQSCSQWPLAEKTGRGSLLNRPSCPPDDAIVHGTELKCTYRVYPSIPLQWICPFLRSWQCQMIQTKKCISWYVFVLSNQSQLCIFINNWHQLDHAYNVFDLQVYGREVNDISLLDKHCSIGVLLPGIKFAAFKSHVQCSNELYQPPLI